MSVIDQAKLLIEQMDRGEKARLLAHLASDPDFEFPGIAITPGVCGGAPRIAGTRIPVWLLAGLRRDGATDDELLAAYPQLTRHQFQDAWSFAEQNRELVDEEIAENEAA